MPQPKASDLLDRKPGDVIQQPEGTYTVNPDGLTTTFTPKPTVATSPPNVQLPTSGSDLQKLQAQRDSLEQRYNDPSTPVEEKTAILAQLDRLGSQIRGDTPKNTVVGPRSSVVGPDGSLIYQGSGVTSASPGSEIVGPNGENLGTVPEPSTSQTTAAASLTSAQASLLQAKIKELSDNHDMSEQDKKDALDAWWKLNIDLPNTEETQAIARQNYAQGAAKTAQATALDQARIDQYNRPSNLQAIHDMFANRGLAAPSTSDMAFTLPGGQSLDGIATAATMRALKDISPMAGAIYNGTLPGTNAPAGQPGSSSIPPGYLTNPGGTAPAGAPGTTSSILSAGGMAPAAASATPLSDQAAAVIAANAPVQQPPAAPAVDPSVAFAAFNRRPVFLGQV